MSFTTANAPSTVKIQTSKQWVLPPRPKPGRKPSLDTPTTKRKAQNRAAQRAFRERKANKIQELEQSLSVLKNERNRFEIALTNSNNENTILNKNFQGLLNEKKSLLSNINQLTDQIKSKRCVSCQNSILSPNTIEMNHNMATNDQSDLVSNLSAKIVYLEKSLDDKNSFIKQLQQQIEFFQRRSSLNLDNMGLSESLTPNNFGDSPFNDSHSNSNNTPGANSASSLPTPASHHASPFSINNDTTSTAPTSNNGGSNNNSEDDCGACDKDECICEAIGIKKAALNADNIIRNQIKLEQEQMNQSIEEFKPLKSVPLKRKISAQEVDFTTNNTDDLSTKQQKFAKLLEISKSKKPKPNPTNKRSSISFSSSSIYNIGQTFDNPSPDIFNNNDLFKSLVSTKDSKDIEPCGFCSDDSPCVCREASDEANESIVQASSCKTHHHHHNTKKEDSKLPPILNKDSTKDTKLQVLHPGDFIDFQPHPPSSRGNKESIIASINKEFQPESSPQSTPSKPGCTGNPGTCLQCQSDPMSTLFCTTIASKVSDERSTPIAKTTSPLLIQGPPPKIRRSTSSSLTTLPLIPPKEDPNPANNNSSFSNSSSINTTNGKQLFIPCADAYKTLSRHESFKKMDFNTLVGKLTTRGMQVEVQSVVNVLRELDRRLYQ